MEQEELKHQSMIVYRSGIAGILFAVLVLSLFVIGVTLHPESIGDTGSSLLIMDIIIVLIMGFAGVWVVRQRNSKVNISLSIGAIAGFVLGIINIAHHFAEFFTPISGRTGLFILGAGHMLLIAAILCIAGSAAQERTDSIVLAVAAGLWAAMLSVLILIAFGLSSNLLFESHAILQMQGSFLGSRMRDSGAFIIRNALESASEGLLRLPVMGLILSTAGGLTNKWMSHRTHRAAIIIAWFIPFLFALGVLLLWHAESLERAARPPFIMFGLLFTGISLTGVYPVLHNSK